MTIGALVGALIADAVNATMLLLFVWVVDIFFGPAMNGNDNAALRALPTHFVTLWTAGLPSRHAGRSPFVGALVWAGAALLLACLAVVRTTPVPGVARLSRADMQGSFSPASACLGAAGGGPRSSPGRTASLAPHGSPTG